MGNDIEIRVRVANNTAAGLASLNQSMNRLRDNARDAGRGLDGLAARAGAATLAIRGLRDATQDASRSLRSLNTAARNADGRLSTMSDRTRTLRRDTDDLDGSMRRLTTTMGGMRGSAGNLRTSMGGSGDGMQRLKTAALALSPALIPIAASAAPIAANLTAAGVAVGAFGLAVAGQLVAVKDAADAQKKYDDAVKKHGRSSEEAAKAEAEYLAQVRQMDPASRRTAAALGVLKDQYKAWSKSLAGDTMPVVTKSLAVFGGLIPKLTPAVKGAAGELDRFMTILAGGVNSSGFSSFMDSFGKFATGALSKANDALVHFMSTMSSGAGSGKLSEFMDYVRRVGPQVGETLANLGRALTHLVAAASETGVGLLTVVNSFAKLVNAIPTGVLSNLLQLYAAMKLVSIAASGLVAVTTAGALARVGAFFQLMRVAGVGPTLSAAAASMTRFQKAALGLGVLGAVTLGIGKLAEKARGAPPDVDRLTTSLKQLATTGKFSGELQKTFGDIDGLVAKIKLLDKETAKSKETAFGFRIPGLDDIADKIADAVNDMSKGDKSLNALTGDFKSLDEAMAGMVSSGYAGQAAQAFNMMRDALLAEGLSMKEINELIPQYRESVAGLKNEQKIVAQGMGLFGEQAVSVGEKLNAQKASADGLRQSIEALNDANRAALGGMIGFEAAIDAAAKAAKDNAGSLDMVNGHLDVNSPKAQAAATALNDLATKTKEAALASRESTGSWEGAIAVYERGQHQFIKSAKAMGLTTAEAKALAKEILNIPDKKTQFKMDTEDARAGLEAFNAAVKKTPDAKSVTLKTLSKGAEQILESFGLKVKRLPDGSVKVTATNGQALSAIGDVNGALGRLPRSRTINITIKHFTQRTQRIITEYQTKYLSGRSQHDVTGSAAGGLVPRYAEGGDVQFAPNGLLRGPGTGTSDSILALFASGAMGAVSDTEFVVNAQSTKKYLPLLELINKDKLSKFAKGGKVTKQQKAEAEARRDAWSDLTVSHFGRMAGYGRSEFGAAVGKPDSLSSLVSALSQWRGIIMKATHGGTENRLLRQLDSTGRKLLGWEKQLTSVTKSLEKARGKLDSLRDAAHSLAGSVKSGVLGSANITRGVSGDGPVTTASIMGGLTASRDKATAFAGALKDLKKKGLSGSLLRQIAEAGIEGGGLETAGALLSASGSEIGSLNDLQSQIGKAAGSAGKTTADAVYGKAIREQTKTVKNLERSQDKLRHSMDKLARSMEKALERAFKGKAAGGIVGAAASGGLRSNLTWVGEQGPELLDLPAGSRVWSNPDSRRMAAAPWASMLNSPRKASYGAPAASSRPQEVKVVLEIRGTTSSRYEEFLVNELRRAVRVRGGNVQKVFGPPRGM